MKGVFHVGCGDTDQDGGVRYPSPTKAPSTIPGSGSRHSGQWKQILRVATSMPTLLPWSTAAVAR